MQFERQLQNRQPLGAELGRTGTASVHKKLKAESQCRAKLNSCQKEQNANSNSSRQRLKLLQWPPKLPASLLEEDRSVAVVRPLGTPPFAATPSFPLLSPSRFHASHSAAPSPGGGERSTLSCVAPLLPPTLSGGSGAGAGAKPMGTRAP